MEIRKIISKLIHIANNFLFPKNCIGCKQSNMFLCQKCASRIKLDNYQVRPDIFAFFPYHHLDIKNLIQLLKYQGVFTVAEDIIEVIIEDIIKIINQEFTKSKNKIVLLPIPLSSRRYRQRGYNQSQKLAHAIVKKKPQVFELNDKVLIKSKNNEPQVQMTNTKKRQQNVIGVFAITEPEIIKERQIIIIDDVVTTGATMIEAMKKIRQAEAQKVIGLAIAHG